MKIDRIWVVYFSPCGNTKKVITAIAELISENLKVTVNTIDFTLPLERREIHNFSETDLVICGTPVYAGRIPNKLLPYVQNNLVGNKALAVPIVVFGNRSFDDALFELKTEMESNDFRVIAGAAFVAQHAFSNRIGKNRPDDLDMRKINKFIEGISEKIKNTIDKFQPIVVKSKNQPIEYYMPKGIDGQPTSFLKAKPKTSNEKCTRCNVCAQKCPMGAINLENPTEVIGSCIKCHACINICQRKAKFFDDKEFLSHKAMLEHNFIHRIESEIFI